ncbi:MAG: PAS domain-containing protein [Deltaproteobacteria bacterium]|nr:MAG: PAS domain-containing protein [Deltaproteobacteria bacterium]UCH06881.1 MAG: PAS domain-containing protein [Deltaproteobacteria bacterium]
MSKNLNALLTNFVSGGIQSKDLGEAKRIRTLNVFLLIFIIVTPLLGVFYSLIGADLLFFTSIIAALLGISDILILRKSKNVPFAAHYGFFILWSTLLIIRWNTGGMSVGTLMPLSWMWSAVLILMAIFITGYLGGTIWTIVIFVETGAAIHFFRKGYEFTNLIPQQIVTTYALGAYLLGLLVILLIAFLYERDKDDAVDSEGIKALALHESKRFIDTIMETSPLPTFVVNNEHRVIQWNRAIQEMTGIREKEIIGKGVPESVRVDDQWSLADIVIEEPNSIAERFSESIVGKADGGVFQLEMHFPALREGMRAIVTTAPLLDMHGSIKGAVETIQDVSDFSAGTRASPSHMNKAIKISPSPVFGIDSNGKISFWNKACEKYLGYSHSQIEGKSPLTFVSRPLRKPFRETVVMVFKGGSIEGREWKYYSAQGEPRYVLANAFSVLSGDGKSKECVVVNTDITGLRLKISQLERDETEAQEQLRRLSDEYELLRKNLARYIRGKGPVEFQEEMVVRELKEEINILKKEIADLKNA